MARPLSPSIVQKWKFCPKMEPRWHDLSVVLPWSGPVQVGSSPSGSGMFGLFNQIICPVKDRSWSKTCRSWFGPRLNANLGNLVFARSTKSLCIVLYLSLRRYCQLSAALVLLQRLKAHYPTAQYSLGHHLFIQAFIIASKS